MSNVPSRKRAQNRLTVLDAILDMYDHTTTVIANEKIFDRTFKSLIDRIDYEASMIYHCCRSANEDYDNRKKEDAEIRIKLEEKALEHCRWLKTDIRLAQKKFHLRAKKAMYWNKLVNNAMEKIEAWHKSEKENYKKNHGM